MEAQPTTFYTIQALRTAVYRFYDARGRLLYVGITMNIKQRWAEHERMPWWPQVARRKVVWYDTRAKAAASELKAIREEGPVHNIAGRVRQPIDIGLTPQERWEYVRRHLREERVITAAVADLREKG